MKKYFGDRLRSVEMLGEGTSQDPAIIVVEFNGGGGWDNAHLKHRIERDMAEAYRLIFQSGVSISQRVVMTAWDETVDHFGKKGEAVVYRTVLEPKQAVRVNWGNPESVNWPLVWETQFIFPDLRN